MKLDTVAIPKNLLLLALYNNALYKAPKFDAAPAIRQRAIGKANGLPMVTQALIAQNLIKEKMNSNKLLFTEVDLGAGLRELNVDLSPFEVDFTQYDDLHGTGTAEQVVKELREAMDAELTEDETSSFLAVITKKINQEMLKKLNVQKQDGGASMAKTTSSFASEDLLLSRLRSVQPQLEQYFNEPTFNNDASSKTFLYDLKAMLTNNVIPEKYTGTVKEFYTLWPTLIDPNGNEQQKKNACKNLFAKHTDKHVSWAGLLFHLPTVITLDFLRYCEIEHIHEYYEYSRKYGKYSPQNTDYFSNFVNILMQSNLYTEGNKKDFIHQLLLFFNNITESTPWNNTDEVKEALACWSFTNSVPPHAEAYLSQDHLKIIQDIDDQLSNLLNTIDQNETCNSLRLDLWKYENKLILKRCFLNLDPSKQDRLFSITQKNHDKKLLDTLFKLLEDCNIEPKSVMSRHVILVAQENYNEQNYPGLFINNIIPFLKSKYTPAEYNDFINRFLPFITPVLYANEEWAFESIQGEILTYWSSQYPEKLVEAIKISIHHKKNMHETPVQRLIDHIPAKYFTDNVINTLLSNLDNLEFITLFSVCTDEVQHKLCTTLLATVQPEHAIEKIKTYHTLYQSTAFPVKFKEGFLKHLNNINQNMFDQVKSEPLFGFKEGQSEFARDLDNLQDILNNKNLTHDQRRSELGRLKALHNAMYKNTDASSVVSTMFAAIPAAQWPYLFVYFDAQIIHWSFPHDEDYLSMLASSNIELPAERTNTWLNNPEAWKNILVNTLVAISDIGFDHTDNGHVVHWALQHVQEALSKTAEYLPDFPNTVLKMFFLENPAARMNVLEKITKDSIDKYDFHAKHIVNDDLIASWLPDEPSERIGALRQFFTSKILNAQNKIDVEKFLKPPFVRNDDEKNRLVMRIINERDMHIVNFLDTCPWEVKKIIIQSLHEMDPSGTENLLAEAINNVMQHVEYNSQPYFHFIDLLFKMINYTAIDKLTFIETNVLNKQKLIDTIRSVDFWKIMKSWDLSSILKLNYQLAPEHLYSKITAYIEHDNKSYFSSFSFEKIVTTANEMTIEPYHSYADYLNNNREDKEKITSLIMDNIKSFTTNASYKEIKCVSLIMPEVLDYILQHLSSAIAKSGALQDRDTYTTKQRHRTLDSLVQVYGAETVISKCKNLGLDKQVDYLKNQFTYYPNILNQINVIETWVRVLMDPKYKSSNKITTMEWNKIHKFNESLREVLLEHAAHDHESGCLVIDFCSDIFEEIIQKAGLHQKDIRLGLPNSVMTLRINIFSTGELSINDSQAYDPERQFQLSEAGIKFASGDQQIKLLDLDDNSKLLLGFQNEPELVDNSKIASSILHAAMRGHPIWAIPTEAAQNEVPKNDQTEGCRKV